MFRKMLPAAVSLLLAVGMVTVSELLHEKEIIFPEITAITIGALAAPKQAWNTSRLRLFLTIMAAAVLGVGIVFLPLSLVLKIPVAMICAIGCVTMLRTGFMPAISACVLPVLLGTRSLIYIVSVAVMTALILLAQYIFEKIGLSEPREFVPISADRRLLELRIKQILIASIICIIPAMTGRIFFIAPPLIVAFFEMSNPQSILMKRVPQVVSLIVLGSVAGVVSRYVITETLGLPLVLPTAVSCAVILLVVCRMKLYFPPCGAIATLPFIIPSEDLLRFPFEIATGAVILTAAAFVLSHERDIAVRIRRVLMPKN